MTSKVQTVPFFGPSPKLPPLILVSVYDPEKSVLSVAAIRTVNNEEFTFFEHDPARTNEQKKLEPSEAAYYRGDWNFSGHPLMKWPEVGTKEEDFAVEVETTKK